MSDRVSEDEIRRIYRETIDTLYGFVSRRCGGQSVDAELPLLVVRGLVWTPAFNYFTGLPGTYDRFSVDVGSERKGVLTASQRRKLPPQISSCMDERVRGSCRRPVLWMGRRWCFDDMMAR
jgi:hypothetical protein